jgi:hypothetical protein
MVRATDTFFFDVDDFPVRGKLPVLPGDATAGQRREANQTDQTHHAASPVSPLSNFYAC